MSALTCIACKLKFELSDDQRDHYKTEFHRFNLKRKVAELPPVSFAQYEQLMEEQRRSLELAVNGKGKKRIGKRNRRAGKAAVAAAGGGGASSSSSAAGPSADLVCQVCGKRFASAQTLEQHISSKKHGVKVIVPVGSSEKPAHEAAPHDEDDLEDDAAARAPAGETGQGAMSEQEREPKTEEEWIEWKIARGVQLPLEACLFCTHVAPSLDQAIEHMGRRHGFVIPDIEFVVDVTAFVHYVSQKVSVGNVCLRCGAGFHSLEAVRSHMRDKSHCRLPLEAEEADEFCEFYDYSLGGTVNDVVDVDSGADPDPAGPTSTALVRQAGQGAQTAQHRRLVAVEAHRLLFSDGRSAGHRSLAHYYKQKYAPVDSRDSVAVAQRVAGQYKLLGLHSALSPEAKRVFKQRKEAEQRRHKKNMQMGVQTNALFVVRPQVIF